MWCNVTRCGQEQFTPHKKALITNRDNWSTHINSQYQNPQHQHLHHLRTSFVSRFPLIFGAIHFLPMPCNDHWPAVSTEPTSWPSRKPGGMWRPLPTSITTVGRCYICIYVYIILSKLRRRMYIYIYNYIYNIECTLCQTVKSKTTPNMIYYFRRKQKGDYNAMKKNWM